MSYLDPPRFHFFGQFLASPSTVNNATENYPLDAVYNNNPPSAFNPTSVFWYPPGTAFFTMPKASVTGALGAKGPMPSDAIVGAEILNIAWGGPPAQLGRIADIDPDMQVRSLVVGVRIGIVLAGTTSPALSGTMRPGNIIDLWGRGAVGGCMYMSVLEDLAWGDVSKSPFLQALQAASSSMLSIKFNVDLYDTNSADPPGQFQNGRIAGTVGPYTAGEGIHVLNARRAWIGSSLVTSQSPMFSAPFKVSGTTLRLDLGNSVPATQANAPLLQWPFADLGAVAAVIDPEGANISVPVYDTVDDYTAQYQTAAGIFDIDLGANAAALKNKPLAIAIAPPQSGQAAVFGLQATLIKEGFPAAAIGPTDLAATGAQIALAENLDGFFAAMDFVALRLQNGAPSWAATPGANDATEVTGDAEVPLYCTQFGQPAATTIDVAITPNQYQWASPEGVSPWIINNKPLSAITFDASVQTVNGKAVVHFAAGPLSASQKAAAEPRRAAVDGQLYTFSFTHTMDPVDPTNPGTIPLTLLVFEDSPAVAQPTWTNDIGPLFTQYARLYPFMKQLIDLADYTTVKNNAQAIQAMMNLPRNDPAFMPVTRDLSLRRLHMIDTWIANGCPQ